MKVTLELLVLCGLSLVGCSPQSPGPTGSVDLGVEAPGDVDVTVPPGPRKLDVLWVVDDGASMCEVQRALAEHMSAFVDALPKEIVADLAMAAVATNVMMDQGRFVSPAILPPSSKWCEDYEFPWCQSDEQCAHPRGPARSCISVPSSPDNRPGDLDWQNVCLLPCDSDEQCCDAFCPPVGCRECLVKCGLPWDEAGEKVCLSNGKDCIDVAPGDWAGWARCHVRAGVSASFLANLEGGIRAAWLALDKDGPNSEQAAGFLRDDAHLLVVFVSDEDDCSIAEEFTSPSFECETDDDCPGISPCVDGLCAGIIKKDYYNICALLGEYKGAAHHDCAYDLECQDCDTDADCEDGWYCKAGKKCRPYIYGFNTIASIQTPAGTPLFALASVSDCHSRLSSLKSDPSMVLVAAIVGDALFQPGDAESMISEACLQNEKLTSCQDFIAAKEMASNKCREEPSTDGCEDFLVVKQACARECYVASKGDNTNPQAKSAYICEGPQGTADWGNRYLRLVEMFGPNGLALNICSPDGFGPMMQHLGEFVREAMER